MRIAIVISLISWTASAQLIPAGRPLPASEKPPVVFLNGYMTSCPTTFASTFSTANQVFQRAGRVSVFFDNCSFGGRLTIEELGNRFGVFLRDLRFENGQSVNQVDVVAHSMGGLIVRSYLAGKQEAEGVFTPPAEIRIHKVVFLATPHFGTTVALNLASDVQANALASGTRFLYDLATWNQGTDDLRGVDAISVIGNAGRGVTNTAQFDDAVTSLTSGSLGFLAAGRTRIVPHCHITGGLVTLLNLCAPGAPGIALINSDTHESGRIILSFLDGNDLWKSIGQAPEQNSFLSTNAGLYVRWKTSADQGLTLDSVTATPPTGSALTLTVRAQQVAYRELAPGQSLSIGLRSGTQTGTEVVTASAGATRVFTFKGGPLVGRVQPAAGSISPLVVAPGMFIAIYGSLFTTSTATAPGQPYPPNLGGADVQANGTAIPLYYVSPTQINGILPEGISGAVKLRVRSSTGEHTVNLMVEPSAPALFTSDGSGRGNVAAINAVTGSIATVQNPLAAGDFVALYLTGLGNTTRRDGLDWANIQPTVTVGGQPCVVGYAGRAPGYAGLDQINCQLAAGLRSDPNTPVVVNSGSRTSNTVTLAIR